MSTANNMIIALAKKYEEQQDAIEATRNELNSLLAEKGVGSYFQDPETNAVYKIVKPTGRYVHYYEIDYNRTALLGEKRGTLSKKEAEEQGFSVK